MVNYLLVNACGLIMEVKEEATAPVSEPTCDVIKDKAKALEVKAEGNSLYGESKFEEVC